MRQPLLFLILTFVSFLANAQSHLPSNNDQRLDHNVGLGFRLFKSERASWMSSDILIVSYRDKVPEIGGYLSYEQGTGIKTIFWDKNDKSKIRLTFEYPDTASFSRYNSDFIDTLSRTASLIERSLIDVKLNALDVINSDPRFFKKYHETSFNLIPLIDHNSTNVFVLTASQNKGKVIFGNDYLLRYDKLGTLQTKTTLHKEITVFEDIAKDSTGLPKKDAVTLHNHSEENDSIITASDICILMLYSKNINWAQHIVISASFVSVWTHQDNNIYVVTRKEWEKAKNSIKR